MPAPAKVGDRIKLVHMPDDPDPIPTGTEGVVTDVTELCRGQDKQWQLHVKWENGRSLTCVCPPDYVSVIVPATSENTDSQSDLQPSHHLE